MLETYNCTTAPTYGYCSTMKATHKVLVYSAESSVGSCLRLQASNADARVTFNCTGTDLGFDPNTCAIFCTNSNSRLPGYTAKSEARNRPFKCYVGTDYLRSDGSRIDGFGDRPQVKEKAGDTHCMFITATCPSDAFLDACRMVNGLHTIRGYDAYSSTPTCASMQESYKQRFPTLDMQCSDKELAFTP